VGPAAVLAPASRALSSYADVAKRNGDIFTLFVPFMAETEYMLRHRQHDALLRDRLPADRAKI
jgi:hypothetical protein